MPYSFVGGRNDESGGQAIADESIEEAGGRGEQIAIKRCRHRELPVEVAAPKFEFQ
jgi:hypothetical protein